MGPTRTVDTYSHERHRSFLDRDHVVVSGVRRAAYAVQRACVPTALSIANLALDAHWQATACEGPNGRTLRAVSQQPRLPVPPFGDGGFHVRDQPRANDVHCRARAKVSNLQLQLLASVLLVPPPGRTRHGKASLVECFCGVYSRRLALRIGAAVTWLGCTLWHITFPYDASGALSASPSLSEIIVDAILLLTARGPLWPQAAPILSAIQFCCFADP